MTGLTGEPTLPAGGGNAMTHAIRPTWLLALVLVAACGSPATPPSTAETAADPGGQAANPPAEQPEPGNAGGIVAPTIGDASYVRGTAHVEVTGQRTLSTDATLVPGVSLTAGGTTLLLYGAGEGEETVLISISNGPDTGLAMTITAPSLTTGGDGSTGCAFEISRNDDSGLSGTFNCRGLSTVSLDTATIDVNGSFAAER
jgi:hypothetical protein